MHVMLEGHSALSLLAGCDVLVACQGPVAELVGLLPVAVWRASLSIAFVLVCIHPRSLLQSLCQIQYSVSQRKACDVFPMAREPSVEFIKVSKEQELSLRALL